MDQDDEEVGLAQGARAGRFTHLAGAVGSAALVVGLLFWGYELAVRDVRGIPVVRALEGPMRVAPATPGGEVTEHQGLAVNQVAANGMAAPLPDTVTLAPRPEALTDEDVAGLMAPPPAEVVTAAATTPAEPVIPAEAATAAAIAAALAEATAEVPAADPVAASAPVAMRPRPRPPLPQPLPATAEVAAPAPAEAAVPPAVPVAEVDPATLSAGTVLIQLDAFDSEADARAAWTTFSSRFPAEFADKALLLDRAESGGVPFWRLRAAGFDGVASARAFCESLRAGGATCIPVAHE